MEVFMKYLNALFIVLVINLSLTAQIYLPDLNNNNFEGLDNKVKALGLSYSKIPIIAQYLRTTNPNKAMIEKFVALGADINMEDDNKITPLTIACINTSLNSDIFNYFIDKKARINQFEILKTEYQDPDIIDRFVKAGLNLACIYKTANEIPRFLDYNDSEIYSKQIKALKILTQNDKTKDIDSKLRTQRIWVVVGLVIDKYYEAASLLLEKDKESYKNVMKNIYSTKLTSSEKEQLTILEWYAPLLLDDVDSTKDLLARNVYKPEEMWDILLTVKSKNIIDFLSSISDFQGDKYQYFDYLVEQNQLDKLAEIKLSSEDFMKFDNMDKLVIALHNNCFPNTLYSINRYTAPSAINRDRPYNHNYPLEDLRLSTLIKTKSNSFDYKTVDFDKILQSDGEKMIYPLTYHELINQLKPSISLFYNKGDEWVNYARMLKVTNGESITSEQLLELVHWNPDWKKYGTAGKDANLFQLRAKSKYLNLFSIDELFNYFLQANDKKGDFCMFMIDSNCISIFQSKFIVTDCTEQDKVSIDKNKKNKDQHGWLYASAGIYTNDFTTYIFLNSLGRNLSITDLIHTINPNISSSYIYEDGWFGIKKTTIKKWFDNNKVGISEEKIKEYSLR